MHYSLEFQENNAFRVRFENIKGISFDHIPLQENI